MAAFFLFLERLSKKTAKKCAKNYEKALTVSGFYRIIEYMEMSGKEKRIRLALKIILPIACVLWLIFILTNSLQTGEQSSAQSSAVVDTVQDVAQVIAPNSGVAKAEGEAYERLHGTIRQMAHFAEFCVLGALFCWCYFAYTSQWHYFYLPLVGVAFTPIFDEFVQQYTSSRAAEFSDIVTDTLGGLAGVLLALAIAGVICVVYKVKKRKREVYPRYATNVK